MKDEKKIGIITLSASDNCGSCLQAYASKKIIEELSGESVEIINFSTKESHFQYDVLPIGKWKYPKEVFYRLKRLNSLIREKRAYEKFREDFLEIDVKDEISPESLPQIANKYNIIFFGSDQIWNVKMSDYSDAFFGGWTKCKKIAFSPSLGGQDIKESLKFEMIKKWLGEFEAISVREKKGQESLKDSLDIDVPILLDPTLVLDLDKWKDIVEMPLVKGRYAFYYSWGYCYKETMKMVEYHCKKDGLPVIVLDSHKWLKESPKKYGFKLSPCEGPLAFLNLMYYSEVCYTESFHGTIFAYIFKKRLWMLDTHKSQDLIDVRLGELVDMFDIYDRVMTPYNYKKLDSLTDVDYGEDDSLETKKKETVEFILRGLGIK